MPTQAPGIAVAGVGDPTLNRGVEFAEADFSRLIGLPAPAQAAVGLAHFASLQAAVVGVDDEAQPRDAVRHRHDLGAVVDGQAQRLQAVDDGGLPAPQLALAVAEQCQVVHVAQVGGAAQLTLVNEATLKQGFDHVAQRVVHDAVAERGGADQAPLGLVNKEVAVGAGPVAEAAQLPLQFEQVIGEPILEGRGTLSAPFTPRCFAVCCQQVVPGCYLGVGVTECGGGHG